MRPSRTCEHLVLEPDIRGRFKSFYHENGKKKCWIWTGSKVKGYGQFRIKNEMCKPHRLSYRLYKGVIPAGMLVLHNCPNGDNPACVNPNHLWLGTYKQNMDDMKRKGRDRRVRGPYGERHPDAKLTENDVKEMRRLRKEKGVKTKELVKMFGVCGIHINAILRRQYWKHI